MHVLRSLPQMKHPPLMAEPATEHATNDIPKKNNNNASQKKHCSLPRMIEAVTSDLPKKHTQ